MASFVDAKSRQGQHAMEGGHSLCAGTGGGGVPQAVVIAVSKGLGELNANKLDKALGKLKEATKTQFNKNKAKFMLYSVRNVFNPLSSSSVNGSSNTNSFINTDLHSKAESAELEKYIANKRALYQKARREYQQITSNSQDMNNLIKEMRKSLRMKKTMWATLARVDRTFLGHENELIVLFLDDSKGPSSSTIPSGDTSSIQKIVQGLHGK
eukprot:scaffold654_cov207-Ochromonas_danica.AAC.20